MVMVDKFMVDKLITRNYHRKKLGEIFIHFGKMHLHLWVPIDSPTYR